jgi:hypothetical protein
MTDPRKAARVAVLVELAALGLAFYLLNRERFPSLGLALQRAAYLGCQQAARGLGTLAIELEKSYRVKVAP